MSPWLDWLQTVNLSSAAAEYSNMPAPAEKVLHPVGFDFANWTYRYS
jgi:hypothetical protein